MNASWPDIPGVTEVGGRPRLPRRPEPVVALLTRACDPDAPRTAAELVELVAVATGADDTRLAGLAGWLPLSRVARWRGDGILALHPETSPHDLGQRYAAWVRSQPVDDEAADRREAYAEAVVRGVAASVRRVGGSGFEDVAPAERPAAAEATELTARLARVLDALDASFLERHDQVRAVLLALLARRHALLLGPPGTAKSMLARAMRTVFSDASYFEYLLSRFTHPDELFGPVSIPGLKDEDYRRLTEGFLPTAQIAFLDEVFKANSAILNSLLTLVNERLFHHGRHRDAAPLLGLIGASNELPDPEGGLAALYDRFLVRLSVPTLSEADAFLSVAAGEVPAPVVDAADAITIADLDVLQARAEAVEVPPDVRRALVDLWRTGGELAWDVSDRRWRQGVGMLRVAVAAEGRSALDTLDLLLLEPVLAPDPSRAAEVREVLLEQIAPRAVPRHDLRAQWALLAVDRVAPRVGEGLDEATGGDFDARLALRRRHAERMVAHAEAEVSRLAADRARTEARGEGRLWLPRLPARVLSAHLEAARELSHILEAAEAYRAGLDDLPQVVRTLIANLPTPERRSFGAGVALRLRVPDAELSVGLTLAAERVDAPGDGPEANERRRTVEAELFDRAPELQVAAGELIALLRGELDAQELVGRLPLHGARNATGVLARLRRRLGVTGVPDPPALP